MKIIVKRLALSGLIVAGINLIPNVAIQLLVFLVLGLFFGVRWAKTRIANRAEGFLMGVVIGAGCTLITFTANNSASIIAESDVALANFVRLMGLASSTYFYTLFIVSPILDMTTSLRRYL